MRAVDWVDRLAGVDSLEVRDLLDGDWLLYPVGPWLTWPWWRRLLDLVRARTVGVALAACAATLYRLTVNPRNLDLTDKRRRVALIPAGLVFSSVRSYHGIAMRWCSSCGNPSHNHRPRQEAVHADA